MSWLDQICCNYVPIHSLLPGPAVYMNYDGSVHRLDLLQTMSAQLYFWAFSYSRQNISVFANELIHTINGKVFDY